MDEKKLESLTPRQAVMELDKYIVGQPRAKRALAVALRNRYRRQLVPKDFRDEITPKNILMIGPTGVGKTELARRMAKLADVPFIKVEATKFTEVGYVGRDVESIVRDLIDTAVNMVQEARQEEVKPQAEGLAPTQHCLRRESGLLPSGASSTQPCWCTRSGSWVPKPVKAGPREPCVRGRPPLPSSTCCGSVWCSSDCWDSVLW